MSIAAQKVKLEAVLANEDALAPGDYPVRIQVVGPDGLRIVDKTVTVWIPKPAPGGATVEPRWQFLFSPRTWRSAGRGGQVPS